MRLFLALGGALALLPALAGCASGERVTLLAPAQEAKRAANDVGAVAVIEADGSETLITEVNQQARLRTGAPRVRQLQQDDPVLTALIAGLPPEVATEVFKFGFNQDRLTGEQLQKLVTRMKIHLDRPDPQIEIAAYTDAPGTEKYNNELSQRRAINVAKQVRELGFTVDPADVVARGEYEANRTARGKRGQSDPSFRIVVVIVR